MKSIKTLAVSATLALMACGDDNAVGHNELPISSFEDSSSSSDAIVTSSSSDVLATSSSSDVAPGSSSSMDPAKFSNGSIITDGQVVDLRDGKTYKTTVIGNQVWMAENLTFDVQSLLQNGKYPLYDKYDGQSYENVYSVLNEIYDGYENVLGMRVSENETNFYFWTIAVDSAGVFSTNAVECAKTYDCSETEFIRGICPEGFHIPSPSEVEQLYRAVGGKCTVPKLNANGTNDYGFSALPTGAITLTYDNGYISYFDNNLYPTVFLTTKSQSLWGIKKVTTRDLGNNEKEILGNLFIEDSYSDYVPVRCLRDEPAGVDWVDPPAPTAPELPDFEYGEFTDTRDGKTYKTVVVNGKTWMDQNLAYSLTDEDFAKVDKLQGPSPSDNDFTCEHPLIGTHVSCGYKFKIDSDYCKAHETSCKNYGKFYTWYEANVVCPAGWRLPTADEIHDFMDSTNPYTIYTGECFTPATSFERLMDKDLNKLLDEDLGKHVDFEFWTSTEASHNKNYVITSLSGGLSKGASENVRCIKE